jgi:hypothetical protein
MQKNMCAIHGEMNLENAYACKNANGSIRLRCKACCHDRRIKQYYLNQDANIKKAGEWKKENRVRVNECERANRQKDLPLTRAKEATRKKGINIDRYNQMIEEQDNKCAICKQPETRRVRSSDEIARLCIDHCHTTLKIRGLLCFHCNVGLGKFFDDIDKLQSAITYLKKHEQ